MGSVVAGVMALSACTGQVMEAPKVGDIHDGQIVYEVSEDGSFRTTPNVSCKHEDGSGQELPCVWRADQRGNLRGDSLIIMSEDEIIRF